MTEVIKSENELCTGCNRCVRACPMELACITYLDENNNIKVKIDLEQCIACGRCVIACKHDARCFVDDTERFFKDLAAGVPISLMAAPAVITNIPEYKRLFTYLKKLGVNKIYDVSLGADICIWAHLKFIEKNGITPMITQPCPAIVTYCEMYHLDLIRRLSPIHSPMACTSIYMKRYQGIEDSIAVLSPCIAKSNEFNETGLAQYNITFSKILAYLELHNIELPEEETEFDHNDSGLGSLFPMPGGLQENIEYFLGKKLHIAKAEGYDVYEKLSIYAETPEELLPDIYDVLNCDEGCNIGSASSHDKSVFKIDKTMDANRKKATAEGNREHYKNTYKAYDEAFELPAFLREYKPILHPLPVITNADIKIAFDRLGKIDYEKQHIDCSACGSDTCYAMARKIVLNVNIPENCIVKSKDDAKTEHDSNLRAIEQLAQMEKMREADERMRVILAVNPHMNVLFDSNFKIIDCNPAAIKFMKFNTKEEMFEGFIDRFAGGLQEYQPDGRATIPIHVRFKNTIETGQEIFETEIHLDDEVKMLAMELRKIPYGSSFAIIAFAHDITEIHNREIELKNAHKINELQLTKLNLILKAAKNGLWDMEIIKNKVGSPESHVVWSDDFRRMFGYMDDKEFPNVLSSWMDNIHPDDVDMVIDKLVEHLTDVTGQAPYDVEYRFLKKSGEYAYCREICATIRDDEGNPLRVIGSTVDMTEQKLMEEQNKAYAVQKVEAESQAKTTFLATMSHEIRTPMNAIIGMTTIGRMSDDIDKKSDALEKIAIASKHMLGVINDILDFSKIESGKFELSLANFEYEKMLQRVVDIVNLRIEERRQKFHVSIDKDIPNTFIGDDQRLSQVITNLLTNASKFTPKEGTIHLDTKLLSVEDGETPNDNKYYRLQVSVEDTGIGITEEQKTRLFNSYEQAQADTTRKYGGTGLGLPISKRIVELMGGNIWVESEPGKGSKFIFTALLERGIDERKRKLDDGVNWKNIRVFVIDDEPEVRELFRTVSEKLKFTCSIAATGTEAIEMIDKDDNSDIYFIDWRLPDMVGGEIVRYLNKKTENNPIAIILSSTDLSLIEEEMHEAGADRFLPKPLFPSMINDVISEYIGAEGMTGNDASALGVIDDFSGHSILIAEDVEINREIVESLLEPTKVSIDCAVNGVKAVEMFEAVPEKYSMIFMDIQMPEMDGYEATRRIRESGVYRADAIPIIAMTANVFREDIERCLEAGMNGHVGKPIDIEEVCAQLRKYLISPGSE